MPNLSKRTTAALLLMAAAPAAATSDFYQTEAGSDVNGNYYSAFAFDAATFSGPNVSIKVKANPVPTVTASATSPCCGPSGAVGQFGYSFTVDGTYHEVVPLLAHVILRASVSGSAHNAAAAAGGGVTIGTDSDLPGASVSGEAYFHYYSYADVASVSIDRWLSYSVYAQVPGYIQGSAGVSTGSIFYSPWGAGHASAHVYLDPFIEIDPVWASTHPGFTLSVSPGFGNSPAGGVPEPANWLMLIAGFGLAGLAMRRRRAVIQG